MLAIQVVVFVLGAAVVVYTVRSAIRTLVVPRGEQIFLTRLVFQVIRWFYKVRTDRANSFAARDRIMASYAAMSLLALPPVWLVLLCLGYTAVFWALDPSSWTNAFHVSGSALLTLGFTTAGGLLPAALEFSEAALGLMVVALLIAYLPTMYAAFQRREMLVTLLEVRAGAPPSVLEMIARYHRIHGLDRLSEMWRRWEEWFADVEESHTSLGALVFFRSPKPNRSWITAAGAVLDSASFAASSLDIPRDPQADLCIRAGFLALRHIADFFHVPYNSDPRPADPISISRAEFDALYTELAERGVPLKKDCEQAWRDFAGWRVNYDAVLLALASLTMAPYAPWSSDRSFIGGRAQSSNSQ